MDNRINIGTQFKTRGKYPKNCRVVDMLTTRNLAGEIVQIEYLCEHEFMGQTVTHKECATTVLRGLIPADA
jgi:hypothetical protein